jgi:hypothetical protein
MIPQSRPLIEVLADILVSLTRILRSARQSTRFTVSAFHIRQLKRASSPLLIVLHYSSPQSPVLQDAVR